MELKVWTARFLAVSLTGRTRWRAPNDHVWQHTGNHIPHRPTHPTGQIAQWDIYLTAAGGNFILTADYPPTALFVDVGNIGDSGAEAWRFNNPGTWVESTTPATVPLEPRSLSLGLSMLLAIAFLARKRIAQGIRPANQDPC